jgi:hypothetical protein
VNHGNVSDRIDEMISEYYLNVTLYEKARDTQLHDPLFKGGLFLSHLDLKEQAILSNGQILKLLLAETQLELCGLTVDYDSQLFDHFNNKTLYLLEAGIIQHWIDQTKKFLDPKYYQRPLLLTKEYLHEIYPKTHPEGAQILTVEQLEAGFVIYLAAVAVCILVFMLEWLVRFKDYLVVHHVLAAYFKSKVIN